MIVINENDYDMTLISKVKERTSPKKLKKIIKDLKNLEEDDIKEFSELKINIFEEKEDEKEPEFKIIVPIVEIQNYFEEKNQIQNKL